MLRNSSKPHELFASKHAERIWTYLTSITGGGAVIAVDATYSNSGRVMENIDTFLSVNLFLGLGALSIAIVALLLPRLLEEAESISTMKKDDRPGPIRKSSFKQMVRAQRRLLVCFMFCIVGVVNSFAFDGVLEYVPNEYQEASVAAHIQNYAGPWADVVEGATSTAVLAAALTFLTLGARTMLTSINQAVKEAEEK